MTNIVDSDQLASSDLDLHCKGRVYPGSVGQGLKLKMKCPKYHINVLLQNGDGYLGS